MLPGLAKKVKIEKRKEKKNQARKKNPTARLLYGPVNKTKPEVRLGVVQLTPNNGASASQPLRPTPESNQSLVIHKNASAQTETDL